MDPLAELLEAVENDGSVPPSWATAHAPEDHLQVAWDRCQDPMALIAVAMLATRDRVGPTRAVCACARAALGRVPPGETRPHRALEITEGWTRGEATLDDVASAHADAAVAAMTGAFWSDADAAWFVYSAVNATVNAAYLPLCDDEDRSAATDAATMAITEATRAVDGSETAAGETLGRFAEVIRAHISCPTLAQLRAALA